MPQIEHKIKLSNGSNAFPGEATQKNIESQTSYFPTNISPPIAVPQ